jgi:hypothetical protein
MLVICGDNLGTAILPCRARQQIEGYSAAQTSEWEVQSRATLDLQERLQMAGQLMGSLETRFHGR